jgi:hypothetical protein
MPLATAALGGYNPLMATAPTLSEADILQQVITGRNGGFAPETARELLKLSFDRSTLSRIRRLLNKNNRGTIQTDERATLDKYLRVGQLIDLLHAQARLSLKHRAG